MKLEEQVKKLLLTINGKPVKVKSFIDYNPVDRSVGIFIGSITVEGEDNKVYDLVTNGNIEQWNDSEDYYKGVVKVGEHTFFDEEDY